MSDGASDSEPAYHLLLSAAESAIATRALHLLIADEAHAPDIRALARAVLALLETTPTAGAQTLNVPLTAPQMKITHSAVKLLLDDTQREQDAERKLLWSILGKLPDEHSLRAIELP
jgi:hypothetical protein